MRTLLVSFLAVVFLTSIASAEVLVTANPLGQGVFGFELAGMQDSNFLDQGNDAKMTSYGGYIGYGILDKLDLYLDIGSMKTSGLPSDQELGGTAYGASLKYTILEEGENMPVSVAAALRYRTVTQDYKVSGTKMGEANYAQSTIGVGVSKIMVPFIPYLGISYKETKQYSDEFATQTDITLGTAIAWSMQGAVFVEYTSQAIQDKMGGVGDHNSGQMALGVAYSLR